METKIDGKKIILIEERSPVMGFAMGGLMCAIALLFLVARPFRSVIDWLIVLGMGGMGGLMIKFMGIDDMGGKVDTWTIDLEKKALVTNVSDSLTEFPFDTIEAAIIVQSSQEGGQAFLKLKDKEEPGHIPGFFGNRELEKLELLIPAINAAIGQTERPELGQKATEWMKEVDAAIKA